MNVNIDYIATIMLDNDKLVYHKIPIEKRNEAALCEMERMVEDEKESLIDLQNYMTHLSLSLHNHNLCIPYEYNNTYVDSPNLPEKLSFYEYQKMCDERLEELLKIQKKKERQGEDYDALEILKRFKRILKEKFYESVYNYVLADEYVSTLIELKDDPNILMYSTETKGWAHFNYNISEDIKIEVKTNFCYGSSSYFRVNLTYKNINILPYADIVKYYYARMVDWERYTRQYRPIRGNWSIALNFVIDIVNLANDNPERFIEEWVKKELDSMMTGLRKILSDTDKELSFYKENPISDAEIYISVRNIREKDIEDFNAFPKEMNIAFKAYKISGALHFFENLKKLEELYPFVTNYLIELEKINLKIHPEVRVIKKEIEIQLKEHNLKKNALIKKLDNLEKKLKPFERILESKLKGIYWKNHQKIREEYINQTPKFATLLEEESDLKQEIWALEDLIKKRENFKKILNDSLVLFEETFGKQKKDANE